MNRASSPAWPYRAALLVVLLAYLVLGLLFNAKTPIWNAPDEPAHYNYVASIANGEGLPILTADAWNSERQQTLISAHFPRGESVDSWRYESHQPPLYYLLQSPVFLSFPDDNLEGRVFALRLMSTVWGLLLVLVTFGIGRLILPGRPWFAVLAAAFAAFVPMFGFINASVNNDSLGNLIGGVVLLTCLAWLRGWQTKTWWRGPALLGILLGLALLTKMTAYGLVAVVGVAMVAKLWSRRSDCLRSLVVTYGVALAISAWWFVRNVWVYGGLDLFGLQRHDAIVVGQPRPGSWGLDSIGDLVTGTFKSFWAQFGWMGVPADDKVYAVAATLTALAILGLIVWLVILLARRGGVSGVFLGGVATLLLFAVIVIGQFLWYNLSFIQYQGRYLFAAMPALAILASLGLGQLLGRRGEAAGAVVVGLGMFALSLYCVLRVLAPAFGT